MVLGDDLGISTTGLFDNKNVANGKTVTLFSTYNGSDVGNYSITDQATTTADVTPKSIVVSGLAAVDKTYDGNTSAAINTSAVVFGGIVAGDDLSVAGVGNFDNKNTGAGKAVAIVSSYGGTDVGNYTFTDQLSSVADIFRLNSVTWIGGLTGDWSDPANWAGGAIPDLANVANVVIPDGVTALFNDSVAGPVQLDSLSGGNLQIDSGTMVVDNDVTLGTFTQTDGDTSFGGDFSFDTATIDGGSLDVTGNVDGTEFVQEGGAISVNGDLDVTDFTQNDGTLGVAGDLEVTNTFYQSPDGSINIDGAVGITHTKGELTVDNLSGGQISLNSTNGGVHLGDINTPGTFDVNAGNGSIDQIPGTNIIADGETTLSATEDVTLDGTSNNFGSTVNASGQNIVLTDGNGGLILVDISTNGNFTANSTDGPVTQPIDGSLDIGGEANVAASEGGQPANVDLGGANNNFQGVVNVSGQDVNIVYNNGGLVLGDINAAGNASLVSSDGNLTQTDSGSVQVAGTSNLAAYVGGKPVDIDLGNSTNEFGGTVDVVAQNLNIKDSDGQISFGTFESAEFTEMAEESLAAVVRDTIVRYREEQSGRLQNIVERFGPRWLQTVLQWENGEAPETELTAPQIEAVAGEVFIRPDGESRKAAATNDDTEIR